MSSWGNFEYGTRDSPYKRRETTREMVTGFVSTALHSVLKQRAIETGVAMYKMRDAMAIGAGTYQNLQRSKPIALATAQKIAVFLGLTLAEVMKRSQQENK